MRRSLLAVVALALLQGCAIHPHFSLLSAAKSPSPAVATTAVALVCPGSWSAAVPDIPTIPDDAGFKGYLTAHEYEVLTAAGLKEFDPETGKRRFDAYATWLTKAGQLERELHGRALDVRVKCIDGGAKP